MKTTTLKAIIRAFNTASTNETRSALCGVLLERDGTTDIIKLVATDGHCLSIQRVTDQELAHEIGEKRFFVDRDNLKLLKLIEKDFKKLLDVGHIVEKSKLSIGIIGVIQCHVKAIGSGDYPNYQAIIPKEDSYTLEICFNPEILMHVYKSLNEEKRSTGIRLKINTTDNHAAIICTHNDQYGLVMPMRF